MICHPNAKINVGLDILRKRPDGYHDLESLFVPYTALQDVLEIEQSDKFSIEITKDSRIMDGSAPGDWDPRKDLTVKAYDLLRKDFQLPAVKIRLEKRIPVGAGLGGGSSDAALTIRMLSEMFDLFLPEVMMEIYAAQLGSDCPFFIYNEPMFVSGRGENLEPFDIPQLSNYDIKVVVPEGVRVQTKEAYAGIIPRIPATALRQALSRGVERWRECVKNDFEETVFQAHPQLAAIKEDLYGSGAIFAAMSGSGSALFGIFRKDNEAQHQNIRP